MSASTKVNDVKKLEPYIPQSAMDKVMKPFQSFLSLCRILVRKINQLYESMIDDIFEANAIQAKELEKRLRRAKRELEMVRELALRREKELEEARLKYPQPKNLKAKTEGYRAMTTEL